VEHLDALPQATGEEGIGANELEYGFSRLGLDHPKTAFRYVGWLKAQRTSDKDFVFVFVDPLDVGLKMLGSGFTMARLVVEENREQHLASSLLALKRLVPSLSGSVFWLCDLNAPALPVRPNV
jgi:hypothetical protein